jgi:hypothetical protein
VSADALLEDAASDPAAAPLLVTYAAAVARDLGDHAGADAVLEGALSAAPLADPAVALELGLQAALSDALVRGDAVAARARLERLAPHPTEPFYPLLAEAAVLATEGRRADAADALRRWLEGARTSRTGAARLRVGNEWALERLGERLGPIAEHERHGPLARLGLLLAGLFFTTAFGALAVLAGTALARAAGAGGELVGPAVAVGLFGVIAAYGVHLTIRGLRGRSRVASGGRLEQALERAVRTGTWLLLPLALGTGWLAAGGLAEFLLLRGPPAARIAWLFLALAVATLAHVVLHELGHLLAAVSLGYHVREVVAGPLRLVRQGGRIRAGWRPGALLSGHVVAWPRTAALARFRHAIFVLAGPAATVAATVACAWALLSPSPSGAAAYALGAGALSGAGVLLGSVVAPKGAAMRSDFQLVRDLVARTTWATPASLAAANDVNDRRRARDWRVSAEELARAAADVADSGGWAQLLAIVRTLDGEEPDAARPLLEAALADSRGGYRLELLLQAALLEALVGADGAAARARLEAAEALDPGPYADLARAAVRLADGDAAGARAALDGWEGAVARSSDPALARLGNHWAIDLLQRRLGPGPAPADGCENRPLDPSGTGGRAADR